MREMTKVLIWASGMTLLVLPTLALVGCGAIPEENALVDDQPVNAAVADAASNVPETGEADQQASSSDGVSSAGDLDGNGAVDSLDEEIFLIRFERAFGSATGTVEYDSSLDINGDGQITWADLQAFVAMMG